MCKPTQNGDKLSVEALVAFGAKINAKNSFNQTPLDVATENQVYEDTVFLLCNACSIGLSLCVILPW